MKTIAYVCPFVPPEWIAAHGLTPTRVLCEAGASGDRLGARPGLCPYVVAVVQTLRSVEAEAVVLTTNCDQMRRAAEWLSEKVSRPVFLLNVPSTWQTPAAQKLYLTELERLGRFLVSLGGSAPSDGRLAEVMTAYDDERRKLRDTRGSVSSRDFAEAIAMFQRTGHFAMPEVSAGRDVSLPLAILGGPLRRQDFLLYEIIEEMGAMVALDGTETGERPLPPPFDRRRLRDAPLDVLADAYFNGIPDPARRPNSRFYQWVREEMTSRGVRGILLRRYLWCDVWHAELGRLKEWSPVPVLELDAEDDLSAESRVRTRVQALIEMTGVGKATQGFRHPKGNMP